MTPRLETADAELLSLVTIVPFIAAIGLLAYLDDTLEPDLSVA